MCLFFFVFFNFHFSLSLEVKRARIERIVYSEQVECFLVGDRRAKRMGGVVLFSGKDCLPDWSAYFFVFDLRRKVKFKFLKGCKVLRNLWIIVVCSFTALTKIAVYGVVEVRLDSVERWLGSICVCICG